MKKKFSFILIVLSLFAPIICHAEITGDITMSVMKTTGPLSFNLGNVTVISPTLNGRINVDFQWDPIVFGFVPVYYKMESTALPSSQNIQGTYSFKSTVVQYSNGTTLTEKDYPVTGSMIIGKNTMSQSLVINGTPASLTGFCNLAYSTSFGNGSGFGVFHVSDSSGTHYLSFSVNGYDMIIYSGLLQLDYSTTYEEYDIWTKTSDGLAAQSLGEENIPHGEYTWLGNFLP